MSYSATGEGHCILKNNITIKDINEAVNTAKTTNPNFEAVMQYDVFADTMYLTDNGHYHEDDVNTFLKIITPLITAGAIEYEGEDDSRWRFKFNSDTSTWVEENGILDYDFESYSDEELIAELKKRGYTVRKD